MCRHVHAMKFLHSYVFTTYSYVQLVHVTILVRGSSHPRSWFRLKIDVINEDVSEDINEDISEDISESTNERINERINESIVQHTLYVSAIRKTPIFRVGACGYRLLIKARSLKQSCSL